MDARRQEPRERHPVENANFLSKLTFVYMFSVFKHCFSNDLVEKDLFRPLKEHESNTLGDQLERRWKEEFKEHPRTALHRALLKLFGMWFLTLGILQLIDQVMMVVILPLSIRHLVAFFEVGQDDISHAQAYGAAISICFCLLKDAFLGHWSMHSLMHMTMKMRIACSSLLYRKTLRLSPAALVNTTVGQLVNLLSNDVTRFEQGLLLAHFAWIAPIQTAVATYLLYREIGVSAFVGIGVLLIVIPIQIWIGQRSYVLRRRTAVRTGERIRLMNEIISGIQVIKMYCWEKPFEKLIDAARRREMRAIRSNAYLQGFMFFLEKFVTRTSIFLSILTYVLLGNNITAETVFAITAIYNVLRPVITVLFSIGITSIPQVHVSVQRIQEFLASEELETIPALQNPCIVQNGNGVAATNGSVNSNHNLLVSQLKYNNDIGSPCIVQNGNGVAVANGSVNSNHNLSVNQLNYNNDNQIVVRPRILLKHASAKWSENSTTNTLENVNLTVDSNQTVAVIGPIGSGKSSLFHVLLKELPLQRGQMEVQGRISFCSQEPWLFSGSVRQNILFGSEFNRTLYEKVVNACALASDFELLPYGDQTLVGERGRALSGGQKARINLARCIYREADIYLLDDPLSAVDANVGKHLFERCIDGFLKDKTCVLITHQLQYLSHTDKIFIMKDGKIEDERSFSELQTSGFDFSELLKPSHKEESSLKKVEDRGESTVEKESMNSGKIKASVYWEFLRAGGGRCLVVILVLVSVFSQLMSSAGDYHTSYWVNAEQDFAKDRLNNLTEPNGTLYRDNIIYVHTGITTLAIIAALSKTSSYTLFFVMASINFHAKSLSKIVRATMEFFNANPSGRILNRFSKDLGCIDEHIPYVFLEVIEIGLQLVGVLVLSAILQPLLLVPSVIQLVIFYFMRMVYMRTSRSAKRIEAITRSPIYNHMTVSVSGLTTIRAFNAQKILIREFDDYQDHHSGAWYLLIASGRCFGFWLDMTSIVFTAVATLVLIYFNKDLYGGDIGLMITQYTGLLSVLQWGFRQSCELENQMVSAERLSEYNRLQTEPERPDDSRLPLEWPDQGKIEFQNVCLKYTPSGPNVLNRLNFVVMPGERVGIVGRTGAGKSSIIAALVQLYPVEGTIIIDDVNITTIPLDQIRSKMSIIPQEPVLFSGTIRKNLDPFEQFNDEILWNALDQVELKHFVSRLPGELHSNVSEGGSNFSIGQRQLLCFARALIRNSKIFVLDEATANVDPDTDSRIQTTLRNQFKHCTVITVAHRLHTVMDSDKILVMNDGCVEEYDHPYVLLQNTEGMLYKMVQATGRDMAVNLRSIAKKSYDAMKKDN